MRWRTNTMGREARFKYILQSNSSWNEIELPDEQNKLARCSRCEMFVQLYLGRD